MLEIISAFEDANNVSVKYKFAFKKRWRCRKNILQSNKIKNKLGWKPKRTLQESLRTTAWEWQKEDYEDISYRRRRFFRKSFMQEASKR